MTEEELGAAWELLRQWVETMGHPDITEGDWYREMQAKGTAEPFWKLYNFYQDDK